MEFTCVVDRYPLNTVSWYKGDDKIQDYDNRIDVSDFVLWGLYYDDGWGRRGGVGVERYCFH